MIVSVSTDLIMKAPLLLRVLLLAPLTVLGLLAQGTNDTLVVSPPEPVVETVNMIPVIALESINPVPEFAPLGVTLATVIELDEPNPLALPVPMPPLAINPGTTLTLRPLSTKWTTISNVQWYKNGSPLANSATAPPPSLVLPAVTTADSASYRATFTGDGTTTGTVFAHILVHPGINHPLVNISTRATISPANPQVVVGFSIPQKITSENLGKGLLIRAVGETLAQFDITNPLPDPILRIFDSAGNDVTPIHVFPTVIYDDGTTPESRYYDTVSSAAVAAGAFAVPVLSQESPPITEYSDLVTLSSGTYTVVVTSAGGQTGEVLVEVYSIGL